MAEMRRAVFEQSSTPIKFQIRAVVLK